MRIGSFHDVVAVDGNRDTISVLDRRGVEHVIAIDPLPNLDVRFEGAFGDLSKSRGGGIIPGVLLEGVRQVQILKDPYFEDPDHQFHLRHLVANTEQGTITWELYCDGTA